MKNKEIYELTPAQQVVNLQAMLSLHKNVVNIMSSMTFDEDLDFEVLKQAFNKVAERNDCLCMRFFSKGFNVYQYFEDERTYDIPVFKFETEEEQMKFIQKQTKKPIAFKKGVVVEPIFIKTYNNKSMVLMKVCHLVLDIYGINMIYKDLYEVYKALKENKELPPLPVSFEEVIKADIKKNHDEEYNKKNHEFFENLFKTNENPYYAGIHGSDDKIWQKQLKKKRHAMKLFLVKNKTIGYSNEIKKEIADKVMSYCAQTKQSPANFLFYCLSITASKMNNNVENMLPMELCNCRGTVQTKKVAGTKAQSALCYTHIDYTKGFRENFNKFSNDQNALYRHVGYSDMKVQQLLHDIYKSKFTEIYYGIAYSFLPMMMPDGAEFMVYSNGHGALPCYVAQLYNVKDGNIICAYDVQDETTKEEHVIKFHNNYLKVLNAVLENPDVNLNDIKF